MKKLLLATCALALLLLVSGCATVAGSSTQDVSIQTRELSGANVAGVLCELSNNAGKWFVTTPGSVTIHRSNDDLQVSCSKDGFVSGKATVASGARRAMFGDIILEGGIVATVNRSDGSAYTYPNDISIVMGRFSKINFLGNQANQQKDIPSSADISQTPLANQSKDEDASTDAARAVKEYQKAAAQGDAEAQYMLGLVYATGEGVPKDTAQAIEWYQKAATRGNVAAQHMLGLVYATGKGVPKDATMAVHWYTKAAAQGNASAQYNLGMAYANSEGVTRDSARAYAWLDLAAAQGNKEAKMMRDVLAKSLSYAQIAEGQRLASSWKKGDIL